MNYDVVIVGAGMAGLTAAAYLSKYGKKVLVIEKQSQTGGLVNTFSFHDFQFDGGIRSIENSGIVLPMLRQLEIDIDFVKSHVSLGLEETILKVDSLASLDQYERLLKEKFPSQDKAIETIMEEIHRIMKYMKILYGIDNPLFLDLKKDKEYLMKTILPWVFQYIVTAPKVQKRFFPVDEYLHKVTTDTQLIDIIAQHFFQKTPSFFALSYFSLYMDYMYPRGGTGTLPRKLTEYVLDHGGEILLNHLVKKISLHNHTLVDDQNQEYTYETLIWAADTKTLYSSIDMTNLGDSLRRKISDKQHYLGDKRGGDSVYTCYITSNLPVQYYSEIATEHFFYTPTLQGISSIAHQDDVAKWKNLSEIFEWWKEYLKRTTYEISIPAMRDETMAPIGKSGLIISALIDYRLVRHVQDLGGYERFKQIGNEMMIEVITASVYPKLKENIIDTFSSTPLTIEKRTGNFEGAITGWAFTNSSMPAVKSLPKIASSAKTVLPDVYQAGQWTYSPSGLPISILTGKLAADAANKNLKKKHRK